MKVRPLVGWLVGLSVAVAAFLTVGVWFIFNVTYSSMHGGYGGNGLAMMASWIGVPALCFCIAYAVKTAIVRRP